MKTFTSATNYAGPSKGVGLIILPITYNHLKFSVMKTCLQKLTALVVILLMANLFFIKDASGQTVLLNETFGTTGAPTLPTGWTASSTDWQNSNVNNSTGYTGASGGNDGYYLNNSTTPRTLTYNNNLSTVGYTNITVLWGARYFAGATITVALSWSSDNITYNTVTFTNVANNTTWALVNGGTRIALPAGAQGIANLRLRLTATAATAGGTTSYRIDDFTVQGTCNTPVLSLTSGLGTNIQNRCISNAISDITYSITGAATNATVSGLPAGVTGTYSTGLFTISGIPTATGTFNYTVTTVSPCTDPTATGTITVSAAPTAVAGTAITTCSNTGAVNIFTGSSASNTSGVTWTSNGDGTFTDANSLTLAKYTPGPNDIIAGSRTLTLTATPNAPCAANAVSTKTITINTLPTAVAGNVISTCSSTGAINITSGSSTTNALSIAWSVTGINPGTFTNATSPTLATYAPSAADITAGSRLLTLTALGKTGCGNVTDTKLINITPTPTAVAGPTLSTCYTSGAVNITGGSSSTNNSGITWTSSGTGTFTDANSLTLAEYTPSGADITAGSVILTLTATPNSPCAANAVSTKTFNISTLPTAVAGNVISTCSSTGAINITSGSGTTNALSIAWSVTGANPGTFANATSITLATYNPSAADITAGSRLLTLTALGKPGCANVTDTKLINITSAPTAVAGPTLSTCYTSGAVNITGGSSSTNNSGITWTSSGTGTFTDANSLTLAEYTPSGADITAGSVILTLTATPNSPCAANAVSTKTFNISTLPTAVAGNVISTCSSTGAINITSGSGTTNALSIAWSVTGANPGTFANATSITLATYNPSAADITAGSRLLTLTALGKPGCANVTDTKLINITPVPTAVAGTAITACANSGGVNITAGSSSLNSSVVTWSSNGDGTFTNANSLTLAEYTPGPNDIIAGSRTLTLTASPNSPCAANAVSTKTIIINAQPAGISITPVSNTICVGATSNLLVPSPIPAAATTIVNYDFNAGASYAALTPVLAANITSSLSASTATFATSTGTATTGSPFTANATAGNALLLNNPDNSKAWIFTLGGTNLNKYKTFKFYLQARSGSFFGPYPGTVSIAYSLNGGAYITTGLSPTSIAPGENAFVAGTFTLPISVNNPSSLSIKITPGSANFSTERLDNFQVQAIPEYLYSWSANTGAGINGLPAGAGSPLVSNSSISVNPTLTTIYTITAQDLQTGCAITGITSTVNVNQNSTISLSSLAGTNAQTVCIENAITDITYAIGGGGTGASITSGALPAGVSGSFSAGVFTISGTPTESGSFSYTVTTSGPCVNNSLSGTIVVNANSTISLSSLAGTDAQTVCINTALSNITYAIGGGGAGASITAGALPAGVSGSFSAGVFTISGIPTVSGSFSYTVTTSGPCVNNSLSGTIEVTADATISLSSLAGTDAQTVCIDNAITDITYAIGGSGTGASITAGALPAGVSGSFSAGIFTISGTPTVSGSFSYTVTTSGPCVNPSLSGTIVVNANSTISLSSLAGTEEQTVCINTALSNITYAIGGGGTGASITAGALPAGVSGSFSAGVFTISGTATVSGSFSYTVTTSGPCVNNSLSGTIDVTADATISLSSAEGTDAQTVCIDNAITDITYAIGGSGSGASITSGSLPAGVSGSFSAGVFTISGTPTVSGSFSYTVTTSGPCVNPSLSGTISVTPNASIASVTGTSPLCIGGTATYAANTVVLSGGTGTWSSDNGSIASVDVNGLVTANAAGSAIITYTITGGCGGTVSASQSVTVNSRPTGVINGSAAYCFGLGLPTTLSIAVTGTGPWSGTLSNGSSFGGNSSPISVIVPAVASTTVYTIATLNDANCTSVAPDLSGSATVTINPPAGTPTASVTQPTCALATGTITVTAPLGAGYSYSIGGPFQPAITFAGVTPGTYSLSVQNNFGCFSLATASVTVDPQPFTPAAPVVTGTSNVCPYINTGTPVTYTATAPGATSYNWTLPANVTLVSGGGTGTIEVTFNGSYATQANKQLRVTASSVCGTSPMTIFYTLAQFPTTPTPITGPTDICALIGTATTATYKINKVTAATSYAWTVPAGFSSVVHPGTGVNDTSIVVTFDNSFVSSSITVSAVNDCGTSGSVRSLYIPRTPASTPGLISGPTNVCEFIAPNGGAATYSVYGIAGTTYTWTPPAGAIGLTGQGSNTISFTYPAGFTSGKITVSASNGCGPSAATRTLNVSKLNPGTPSVIDVVAAVACPNRVYTYSLSTMPANATSVLWTVPVGATITAGLGTFSITVSYPGTAITGNVTAQAINNCGVSTIRISAVKLPACPVEPPPPPFAKGTVQPTASESMAVNVFPNPTVNDFKLQVLTAGKESIKVRVLDMQGKQLKQSVVMPYQTISIGNELKAGSYMIEVRQGGEVKTVRVVKF